MESKIILESQYFPPLASFYYGSQTATWCVEACENYQKGSFRNRCWIHGTAGPILLSIPLKKGKNKQTPIEEVRISFDMDWQLSHWNNIVAAYSNSAYFQYYKDLVKNLIFLKSEFLFERNYHILEILKEALGFKFNSEKTSQYVIEYANNCIDLRVLFSPKLRLSDEEQNVLEHLKSYSSLLPFKIPVSKLSILDILFHLGPETFAFLKHCGE